jgi:hypothetical protein
MKMIISMLLLCLTSFPIADKSEKLEAQLGSIQKEVLKSYQELKEFQKWARENDGIVDESEATKILELKKDNLAILKRLNDIAHSKLLNLPLSTVVENLLSRITKNDAVATIPKDDFYALLMKIAKNLKDVTNNVKNRLSSEAYIFSVENLNKISNEFLNTAEVCFALKNDISIVISKVKEGEKAVDLLNNIAAVLDNYMDEKFLKKKYPGHRNESEKEISDGIIEPEKLLEILDSAINPDGYLTEKEEEVKRKEDKAKKEKLEANISEFNRQYAAWLKESKEVPAKIISQISGTEANSQLKKQKIIRVFLNVADGWKNHQPDLSIEIIDKILSKVKAVERDTIAVKVIADAMRDALLNIETPMLNIFKEWDKHKIFPSFYDLQSCVTTSTEDDYSQKLLDFYMEWFQKNGSILDRLQLERKFPSTQLFKINDLLSNLKYIFKEDYNSFFYPVLEKNIKETGVINSSLEKLNQAWKASLMNVIVTSNNIDNYYKKLPKEDTTVLKQKILNVETLMETMAGSDTIKIAFLNALYIAPVLPQIASGETLSFNIVLNDGTILRNTVFTKIVRDKSYYAEAISVSVTPTSGKRGFSFQEVKDFTTIDAITSGDTVSYYFEYKIPFTKDKGSQSKAVENSRVLSFETVIGNSETDVNMSNFNIEKSFGLGGKLGPIDVENTTIIGGGKQWGKEKTNSFELAFGRSYGQSESNARNTELGENSGFFHIKLSLMTAGQDEETIEVILSAEPDWISSPDSKGFSTKKPDDVKKVMRWKK